MSVLDPSSLGDAGQPFWSMVGQHSPVSTRRWPLSLRPLGHIPCPFQNVCGSPLISKSDTISFSTRTNVG
jgi:hypothetical protein